MMSVSEAVNVFEQVLVQYRAFASLKEALDAVVIWNQTLMEKQAQVHDLTASLVDMQAERADLAKAIQDSHDELEAFKKQVEDRKTDLEARFQDSKERMEKDLADTNMKLTTARSELAALVAKLG